MAKNKKVKLAINGFGRIGRVAVRAWWESYRDSIEIVAVNTSGSMNTIGWTHLLKYDSVYGRILTKVEAVDPKKGKEIGRIVINGMEIPVLAERDPVKIPWKNYDVDVVLECTGVFKDKSAEAHLRSGARKVVLSAPARDELIPTFIFGVNEERYKGERLISNGSCTTNCVAPIVKLIDEEFGFEECVMTTIHAYTASQQIVDGSGGNLREARAAGVNIIPTETGAAKAVEACYPEAKGRFSASAIRVPVVCGSFADFVFKLKKKVTVEKVNFVFEEIAAGKLAGIIKVSYEPLVSSDIIGNSASAIVDLPMTEVVSNDMIKVSAWYDNEYGYSCRLLEMAELVGK